MRTNLLYNKIVADTASEGFIESFNKIALPKLTEKFPEADEVIIYEDYLSDGLMANGSFYCPLTLSFDGGCSRAIASWRCDSKRFESSIPYAYIGKELLNIEISDTAPEAIEKKIEGRVPFFASDAIKLKFEAAAPTKTFLSGRYSQSFVELMREGITRALEKEFRITGVKDSTLEISLAFLPESFMEHVADNVSYRRVLISASACSKRDLWIKWTRLDGCGNYTISSRVAKEDVLFELCDEVPDKIREREYRYLIRSAGHSAYKNAMSRKNFTEWRELLKRVIKRGEVCELPEDNVAVIDNAHDEPVIEEPILELPTEPLREIPSEDNTYSEPAEIDAFDSEITLKLKSVLESYDISTSTEEALEEEEINPDLTKLLSAFVPGYSEETDTTGDVFSDSTPEEDELPPFDMDDDLSGFVEEELAEVSDEEIADDAEELEKNEELEEIEEPEEIEEHEEIEEPEKIEEVTYEEFIPKYSYETVSGDISEKENEIISLKEKNEELLQKLSDAEAENERLLELVTSYEKKIEEAHSERMTLIESLDAAKRREERVRDRLAEAARLAVAERREEDKPVYNEEAPKEEPVAKAPEVIASVEEDEPQAPEASVAEIAPQIDEKTEISTPVRYVSKVADISFRHPVDPNITKRIQDIIVTTVKYFGKENVYMKIKATIPDSFMVRLEFVKIPENESELLADIIRVLGHSKLGITKVLLD